MVYLGRLTQNGSNPHETSRTVIKVIKHPKHNSLDQKLALVKLSSPVTFTDYIKPVCLAAAGSVFVDGTESWVTGWGIIGVDGEEHCFKIRRCQKFFFRIDKVFYVFILCDRIDRIQVS